MTETALGMLLAARVVPSIGSTATSQSGPVPSPTCSPLYSIGAWSFSPSPMTTTPFICTVLISVRIALTATPSAPFLSPRPTQRPAAMAPASVTLTRSRARLRSGAWAAGCRLSTGSEYRPHHSHGLVSHFSRSAASTTMLSASSTMLSAIAGSGSVCRAV